MSNGIKKKKEIVVIHRIIWVVTGVLGNFAAVISPLIPILVAGGLIFAVRNIIDLTVSSSQIAMFVSNFLLVLAQAIFWWIPVSVSWSVFRRAKGSEVLGIVIGLSLLIGSFSSNDGLSIRDNGLNFGYFIKYPLKISYIGQLIPAYLISSFGVWIERFLLRYVGVYLRQVVVPVTTILVSFFVGIFVIGPIGFVVGNFVISLIRLGFALPGWRYFVAPLFGLLYPFFVMTGFHSLLNIVMIQETVETGSTFIFPIVALSNTCQGISCLTYAYLRKIKDAKAQNDVSSGIVSLFGVTEPAMYGVNLVHLFPFIASIFSSAIGGLMSILTGISSDGVGSGGILGFLSIRPNQGIDGLVEWFPKGMFWFVIILLVCIVSSFLLTCLFSRIGAFTRNFEYYYLKEREWRSKKRNG